MSAGSFGGAFTPVSSNPAAAGAVNNMNNGTSENPAGTGVLGQNVGEVGNPAVLLSNREIPLSTFVVSLTASDGKEILLGVTPGFFFGVAITGFFDGLADRPPAVEFKDSTSANLVRLQMSVSGVFVIENGTFNIATFDFSSPAITFNADLISDFPIIGKMSVSPQTGNFGPGTQDSRTIFTNEGAAGAITVTLPSAAAGFDYIFIVQSANNIVITAAAGDTIRIAGAVSSAGGTATNGTIGSVLRISTINATEWIAREVQGAWVLA